MSESLPRTDVLTHWFKDKTEQNTSIGKKNFRLVVNKKCTSGDQIKRFMVTTKASLTKRDAWATPLTIAFHRLHIAFLFRRNDLVGFIQFIFARFTLWSTTEERQNWLLSHNDMPLRKSISIIIIRQYRTSKVSVNKFTKYQIANKLTGKKWI